MTPKSYDAVIIGAGHNGLACAIHLAKNGWKVGVFEAKSEAGGAVKTRELTLPGFNHDVCAMNLSMFAGSPFMKQHGEALGRHGLAFAPAEHCFATAFPDATWFGISKNLDLTLNRMGEKDRASFQLMLQKFGDEAPLIFGILGNQMPSFAAAKLIYAAWRKHGMTWLLGLLKFLLSSPRSWLDQHFESEKVKTALAA